MFPSRRKYLVSLAAMLAASSASMCALAGLDHKVTYDNSGIWNRNVQKGVEYTVLGTEIAGAAWEGGETELGKTFWQAIDASAFSAVTAELMKRGFSRVRPGDTDSPNEWFKGDHNRSFPSGEVTFISSAVTPFVLEYGKEYPAVYALDLLPLYDAIARVKVQAHWQTDVIAGFALGAGFAYLAHERDSPIILSVMPHGVWVGIKRSF
jgi:undecaprenyl-diphosphatase